MTGRSGLDEAAGDFALAAELGVHYRGPAEFAPDYLALEPALGAGIEPMAHVCQLPGVRTAGMIVRRKQADLMIHVLHYVHQRRGQGLDVIEDTLPLQDITLHVPAARKPESVRLAPDGQPVAWDWQDGGVRVTLPRVDGYALVQLEGVR